MKHDMTDRCRTTDLGVIKINNNAITTIASIAAMEVRGVGRIGGGIGKTFYEILTGKPGSKGVKIHSADNEFKITIYITVEYGVDLARIADEVQENVKTAVEKMTGLVLSAVDVVIEGVRQPSLPGEK